LNNYHFISIDTKKPNNIRGLNEQWSGEATRSSGFVVEDTRVDVLIGDEIQDDNVNNIRKERPIWLMESTIITTDVSQVIIFYLIVKSQNRIN
jgi:transcription initiation factor TFIIE subunit alpha